MTWLLITRNLSQRFCPWMRSSSSSSRCARMAPRLLLPRTCCSLPLSVASSAELVSSRCTFSVGDAIDCPVAAAAASAVADCGGLLSSKHSKRGNVERAQLKIKDLFERQQLSDIVLLFYSLKSKSKESLDLDTVRLVMHAFVNERRCSSLSFVLIGFFFLPAVCQPIASLVVRLGSRRLLTWCAICSVWAVKLLRPRRS